jgi:hypothetical protein
MPTLEELQRLFQERLRAARHIGKRSMLTGKRLSSTQVELRSSTMTANQVWVRSENESRDAVQAYGFVNQANIQVYVEEGPGGELIITGPVYPVANITAGDALGSALTPVLYGDVATAEWTGQNLRMGRVRRSLAGGLYVTVEAFSYPTANGVSRQENIDFLMTPPGTASRQAWCAVVFDPRTAALSQVTGTLYDTTITMTDEQADTDLVIPAGRIALGAVLLANGQTVIGAGNRMLDLRRWIAPEVPHGNYAATTDPVAGDDAADGYAVGSFWYNTTLDRAWVCLDAAAGAAVWLRVDNTASALSVQEQDGTPNVSNVTTIKVANGTLTDNGGGTVSISNAVPSLTVQEQDGSPSVSSVTTIKVANGTLTDNGGGTVSIATGSGGSGEPVFQWQMFM